MSLCLPVWRQEYLSFSLPFCQLLSRTRQKRGSEPVESSETEIGSWVEGSKVAGLMGAVSLHTRGLQRQEGLRTETSTENWSWRPSRPEGKIRKGLCGLRESGIKCERVFPSGFTVNTLYSENIQLLLEFCFSLSLMVLGKFKKKRNLENSHD